MPMNFKPNPLYCRLALLVSITMILSGCQQEEQYLKKMGFKPALATTKVTLAATSYIRFASKIEEQQSIDIASLQSGRLHKLHITEGMQVKKGQALMSIVNAFTMRFHDVLLTSLTTIVGMLSVAVSTSPLWPPLAWTMIGGLLFSTLLTLVVLPCCAKLICTDKFMKRFQG